MTTQQPLGNNIGAASVAFKGLTQSARETGGVLNRTILPALGLSAAFGILSGGLGGAGGAGYASSSAMLALNASMYELQNQISRALTPVIEELVPIAEGLVDTWLELDESTDGWATRIALGAAALIALKGPIGSVIRLMRSLRTATVAATAAQTALNAAQGGGVGGGAGKGLRKGFSATTNAKGVTQYRNAAGQFTTAAQARGGIAGTLGRIGGAVGGKGIAAGTIAAPIAGAAALAVPAAVAGGLGVAGYKAYQNVTGSTDVQIPDEIRRPLQEQYDREFNERTDRALAGEDVEVGRRRTAARTVRIANEDLRAIAQGRPVNISVTGYDNDALIAQIRGLIESGQLDGFR